MEIFLSAVKKFKEHFADLKNLIQVFLATHKIFQRSTQALEVFPRTNKNFQAPARALEIFQHLLKKRLIYFNHKNNSYAESKALNEALQSSLQRVHLTQSFKNIPNLHANSLELSQEKHRPQSGPSASTIGRDTRLSMLIRVEIFPTYLGTVL